MKKLFASIFLIWNISSFGCKAQNTASFGGGAGIFADMLWQPQINLVLNDNFSVGKKIFTLGIEINRGSGYNKNFNIDKSPYVVFPTPGSRSANNISVDFRFGSFLKWNVNAGLSFIYGNSQFTHNIGGFTLMTYNNFSAHGLNVFLDRTIYHKSSFLMNLVIKGQINYHFASQLLLGITIGKQFNPISIKRHD